jgi:hypothetical protein
VRGLAVYCLNHSSRHHTVISADEYPDDIEVPSFGLRMKCSKCGGNSCKIDVRPDWIDGEMPPQRGAMKYRARWPARYDDDQLAKGFALDIPSARGTVERVP